MTSLATVALGDMVASVESWTPEQDDPNGLFTYIDLSAVDQEDKEISAARVVPCGEAPSRARQLVRSGDVLVSTVRPNLNGVARVPADLDGATASTGFCVLRARTDKLDHGYLFHWVRSPRFVEEMVRKASGASYPAVSDRIVLESKLPILPLREQNRIAEILDKADALRTKRRAALAQLDILAQSIFLAMFGDPVRNERRFQTKRLIDLVDPDRGISYGVVQRGNDVSNGVPLVRITDVVFGEIVPGALKRTAVEIAAKYRRTALRGGELVISIRGTVGRCALVPKELSGGNITRELALIPHRGVNPTFLLTLLRSDSVQRVISGDVKGIAQRGINLEDLRELPIIVPPSSEVARFSRQNEAVDTLKTVHRASLLKLGALTASLQHRAFRGEL